METNLWTIRFKSMGWSLLGVVITSVAGYFMSDTFGELITEFTGTGLAFIIIKEIVTGTMLHLRNKGLVAGARRYGSSDVSDLELL